MSERVDIAVVGGGLVGLMAVHELALAMPDRSVALIAPPFEPSDGRTTAMLMPSVERLVDFGLWQELEPHAAALRTMRIIDGSSRLLRAPTTTFDAHEIEQEAFGYNVPNALAGQVLEASLLALPNVSRFDAMLTDASLAEGAVDLTLTDGSILRAGTVAAADGRNSLLRDVADIGTLDWTYPQTALVTTFTHTLPHNDTSTEFHTETGPFTQVPLPPTELARHRSSLVWVVTPQEAETLLRQPVETLSLVAEKRMQSMLGRVTFEVEPQAFPLAGMMARSFAGGSIALLGEAAHVFPPIGAQGFNLGIRDVVTLAQCLGSGAEKPLEEFDRQRRRDVLVRTAGVDALNRSVLTDMLPVQAARALGMGLLGQFAPLRRAIMRQGLGRAA